MRPPEPGAQMSKETQGLMEYARTATAGGLRRERSAQKSDQIFRKAALVTDSKIRNILDGIEHMPAEWKELNLPKCSSGCAYCCYQWVRASIPEAIVVGRFIREHWSSERIAGLLEALAIYRIAHREVPPGMMSSLACPLLDDGNRCTVYDVRPFICRGCNSLDVEACRLGMEDPYSGVKIPVIMPVVHTAGAMRTGMGEGLRAVGLQSDDVVFGLALETVLSKPDAADRYFAGERVFEDDLASMDELNVLGL